MLSSCVSAPLASAPGTWPVKAERGLYLLYPPKGLPGTLARPLGTGPEGTDVRTATWAGMGMRPGEDFGETHWRF